MGAIPESEWVWHGTPGHFICSPDCLFHMTTEIGGVLVSTVGEHHPHPRKDKPESVGLGRLYETMVFPITNRCALVECGACGHPDCEYGEPLDFAGYNTRKGARLGHMEMCRKWAAYRHGDAPAITPTTEPGGR